MTSIKRKEKVTVTIVNFRRMIFKRASKAGFFRRCEECDENSLLISASEAAILINATARQIFRLVESGELHFVETINGETFVCRRSLLDAGSDKIK